MSKLIVPDVFLKLKDLSLRECDDKAWLVNDDGKMRIIVSDHGHKYFTDKSFLEQKIKEYQSAIEETNEVLNQLN